MINLALDGLPKNAFPEVSPVSDRIKAVVIPENLNPINPVSEEQTVTVPEGSNYVKFTSTGDFFAAFRGLPVYVPGGEGVVEGVFSILNPTTEYIRDVPRIKVNAFGLTRIYLEFFS